MERQMAIVPQKADKSADQPNMAISNRNAPKFEAAQNTPHNAHFPK
jgi:hypothetical protein